MLKHNAPISKHKKVRILIKTDYHWGSGWESREKADNFRLELNRKLRGAGYEIKYPDISSACCYIKEIDGTYLYLHPMEISGYLKQEDLDKVLEILKRCESIEEITKVETEDVYEISNFQYEKILKDNGKFIYEWILNNPHKDEFDFVREFRIPRKGDSSATCSSDCDIVYIKHFMDFVDIVKTVK